MAEETLTVAREKGRTTRLTASQAIVEYLKAEGIPYVLGIFGHGNVQLGEALAENSEELPYIQVKNEQNAVHIAAGYAKHCKRPLAVTTSIGPGTTNLVTGAAAARVNRLPVLLLPGDAFADGVGPVLQQIEGNTQPDEMASDTLKPVSRYWVRISRPEQLRKRLPEAFDAMLDPGNEGPAVLALPMDVQAEAAEYDLELLTKPRGREWERTLPDPRSVQQAVARIKAASRPLIIAGGGVLRSEAWEEVITLAERIGAPVVQTQAGNGTMLWDHHLNGFTVGPDGSSCGNRLSKRADLVIGIGTRYSDFTTSSETAFGPEVDFININICAFDVAKQRAIKLKGDALASLEALDAALEGYQVDLVGSDYYRQLQNEREEWMQEVDRVTSIDETPMNQNRVIGVLNEVTPENTVVVCAAGSLPGHLLRLWKTKDPARKGYHCEYGFSTMGYEIAGGIGVKLAEPERDVVVMIGDATFMMAPQAILTAVQERIALTIVVVDNHGPQVIRNLQSFAGFQEYGNEFVDKEGKYLDIDFVAIARGMGATALKAENPEAFAKALEEARANTSRPTVIHVPVEPGRKFLKGYDGWWDVPRPQVTDREDLKWQNKQYRQEKKGQAVR